MTRRNLIILGIILALFLTGCFSAKWELGNLNPTKRRAKFLAANPNTEYAATIKSGNLMRGMTEAEVIAAIGSNWTKNRSTGSYGVHEQWVLPHNSMRDRRYGYLYFQNGILVSWQSKRLRI